MPPRRTHTKSRAGCQRCKTRKIKCDEVHPHCGNCEKHGVSCDFSDPAAAASPVRFRAQSGTGGALQARSPHPNTPNPTPHTPQTPVTPAHLLPLNPPPQEHALYSRYSSTSRTLEMRLLHHYTATTAKTLAAVSSSSTEEAWQIHVPTLAFDSPCLMDAILAVSALHLRSMNPTDKSLIRASHGYMASALSQYSSVLMRGVDASNAEAIFTTSALIAFQASASRSFPDSLYPASPSEPDSPEPYTLPIQWFHSFQGVKAVVLACWKWLRHSERVKPIINAQPALALDINPSRPQFFSSLLDGLDEDLQSLDELKRSETKQAYEHSVAYLNWGHQKPDRARILGFPATVSRRFVELVEQHDPRALVIMSCFFAMTKVVDEVWWLQDVATREVNGIMGFVPREWWPRMEWPMKVTSHIGVMDEETWGEGWESAIEERERATGGDVHTHIEILTALSPPCEVALQVVAHGH